MSDPRPPPWSQEAEQAVLGGVLLRSDALAVCLAVPLAAEDFYLPKHGWFFGAMMALRGASKPIDPLTLQDELRCRGQEEASGGLAYLGDLLSRVPTAIESPPGTARARMPPSAAAGAQTRRRARCGRRRGGRRPLERVQQHPP